MHSSPPAIGNPQGFPTDSSKNDIALLMLGYLDEGRVSRLADPASFPARRKAVDAHVTPVAYAEPVAELHRSKLDGVVAQRPDVDVAFPLHALHLLSLHVMEHF